MAVTGKVSMDVRKAILVMAGSVVVACDDLQRPIAPTSEDVMELVIQSAGAAPRIADGRSPIAMSVRLSGRARVKVKVEASSGHFEGTGGKKVVEGFTEPIRDSNVVALNVVFVMPTVPADIRIAASVDEFRVERVITEGELMRVIPSEVSVTAGVFETGSTGNRQTKVTVTTSSEAGTVTAGYPVGFMVTQDSAGVIDTLVAKTGKTDGNGRFATTAVVHPNDIRFAAAGDTVLTVHAWSMGEKTATVVPIRLLRVGSEIRDDTTVVYRAGG